jgi:type 2A phosphatase activator TIP41
MSEALNLPSLPEMVFGKNKFELFERSSGFRLEFTALDALKMVSHQPPHDIKVAASSVWSESNKGQVAKLKQNSYLKEADNAHQDFDWTFTTRFSGLMTQLHPSTLEIIPGYAPTIVSTGLDAERDGIPMAKLRSTSEPILWFSHVHLFEDELHDNGIAEISTKARVMGTFWFCLVRFWLRVDGVMFRVIDHRLYHEFGSSHIIKETTTKEGSWDSVTQKVEGDLKKIKDPSEFSNHLATISSSLEHIKLPSAPSS